MARDGVVNVVTRLTNCGYDPRKVGDDAWESRCPAHRSADHALAITRGPFDHVVLECRSARKCAHTRIISALGLTNEHVYAETPEAWIRRLGIVQIAPQLRLHGLSINFERTRDARIVTLQADSSMTNPSQLNASNA
jgi:hypothetical protein